MTKDFMSEAFWMTVAGLSWYRPLLTARTEWSGSAEGPCCCTRETPTSTRS